MSKDALDLRRRVLLTMQVALLGLVPPNLRAVTVGWSNELLEGKFYFEGVLSDTELEIVSEIETEVMASFPDHEVAFDGIRLDQPEKAEYAGCLGLLANGAVTWESLSQTLPELL